VSGRDVKPQDVITGRRPTPEERERIADDLQAYFRAGLASEPADPDVEARLAPYFERLGLKLSEAKGREEPFPTEALIESERELPQ
jgi:hypothetical protein